MSDLDDDFMQMSEDEEDFSFEYEEDDEVMDDAIDDDNEQDDDDQGNLDQNTIDVDIEYLYYAAKATKEEDISKAIDQFKQVIAQFQDTTTDQSRLEYIFKSIKQVMKLYYHINQLDQLMQLVPVFFKVLRLLANRSYGEESINKLVDHYDKPKSTSQFLSQFLDEIITGVIDIYKQPNLSHSRLIPQDRLWLKLNLKKANLMIRNDNKDQLLTLLSSLQEICENSTENIKGSYMLEIIALQIQLYSELANTTNILKELYDKSFEINSAVPHPRVMGIIKECGGEIYMSQLNYQKAANEFYESFKNYDELGDNKRILMLKRLMISNMLSENEINPFHSKEFQSFVKLDEIQIFLKLYNSFMSNDIKKFNALIEQNIDGSGFVFDDPFLTTYVEELKTIIQARTIVLLTKYYSKLELSFLSEYLHCDIRTVQLHILKLINSGKLINLRIDYVLEIVEVIEPASDFKILGNIDAKDIIQNIQDASREQDAATDIDGDHLMNDHHNHDQPSSSSSQPLPPPSSASDNVIPKLQPIVNERSDYIKLSHGVIQSLNLILGNFNQVVVKEDDHSKTSSIYSATLQSILQDWLNILVKSIPIKIRENLSQIEQVKLEQLQQLQIQDNTDNGGNSGNSNITNNEVEKETLMGELTLDVNVNLDDHAEDTTNIDTQTDGLRYLIKSIKLYQQRLMTHYDEKAKFADSLLKRYEEK